MRLNYCEQKSPEWWTEKVGKVSGTRFGQLISSRANRLKFDLLSEKLDGIIIEDEYISPAMQFGIDNEPVAREKYIKKSGINFGEVGLIYSDFSDIHLASPDGLDIETKSKVLEIKCTEDGGIHIQRFFNGPESSYESQIINYFACSDQIQEVHWVSYCPGRPERELVIKIFTPNDFKVEIMKGRQLLKKLERELADLEQQFIF